MATLNSVAELLNGDGESLPGFEGDIQQAEAYAILHFSGRPYCLVKDWVIVEVVETDLDSLAPSVLYAAQVMLHSDRNRGRKTRVLGELQQPTIVGHLFQTQDTTYVLMGPGKRGRATPAALSTIS